MGLRGRRAGRVWHIGARPHARIGTGTLVLLGVLATLALLVPFEAPTFTAWRLAVLATECGHLLAVPALLVSLRGRLPVAARVLALGVGLVFLLPVIEARAISRTLPEQLQLAFPLDAAQEAGPPGVLELLTGVGGDALAATTYTYRELPEGSLRIDVHRPDEDPRPRPWCLIVHGGGWSGGTRAELAHFTRWLASRGCVALVPDYRLAPAARHPAQAEDVRAAVGWLRSESRMLGLDPDRGVLIGRSAGGQIALEVAYRDRPPGVRGVVAFYAPADMEYAGTADFNPWILDARAMLADYLGARHADAPRLYAAASPLLAADAAAPPTLVIHGRRDELVAFEHARRLHARLGALGVRRFLLAPPRMTHGAEYVAFGPSAALVRRAVEHFLRWSLGTEAATAG